MIINNTYPLASRETLISDNTPVGFSGEGNIFITQPNTLLKVMTVCFKPREKFVFLHYVPQKGMKEYLVAQGFPQAGDDSCNTTKPEEMRKLFELVVANNNIDLGEANRLRRLLNTNFTDTGVGVTRITSVFATKN